ncbi:MAG: response regulator [Oscillospiraceae bacterium]
MQQPPEVSGTLRKFMLKVPEAINECSGIVVFGKLIKSIVFSTDISILRNINADAVIAVYPFTPQPIITQAIMMATDKPVFCGVGGGLTHGKRVQNLALHAEHQGAAGVVLNAPTENDVLKRVSDTVDIPAIITVVNDSENIALRVLNGAKVFNVSAALNTPNIVAKIRKEFPEIPIIATGGQTEETIRNTINAGANAITWTPPTSGDIFKTIMEAYRNNEPHP